MDFSIMRQFLRALICYLAKAEQISDITVVVQLHLQKIILCTTFLITLKLGDLMDNGLDGSLQHPGFKRVHSYLSM